jgi:hypothetical protein
VGADRSHLVIGDHDARGAHRLRDSLELPRVDDDLLTSANPKTPYDYGSDAGSGMRP